MLLRRRKMVETPASAIRNLCVLCLSLLLLYTGFSCSVSLTSSLNINQGLGQFSLAAASLVHIPAALTLPPLTLKMAGIKGSIVVGILFYIPYVAANFYPSWYTLPVGAVLQGLGSGPLWTAAMAHLDHQAKVYSGSSANRDAQDTTLFFFMGILFACTGLTHVIGHVISLTVLEQPNSKESSRPGTDICGVRFCDSDAIKHEAIVMPSLESVHLLAGIYLCFSLFGLLLAALALDQVPLNEAGIHEVSSSGSHSIPSCLGLLAAPLQRMRHPKHLLLTPISIFSGLNVNFLSGDFTKAYVACTWGVRWIGSTLIPFGSVLCVASPSLGYLTKVVDRAYIMAAATILHLLVLALLWTWRTDYPDWILYLIPAIYGITSVAFVVQIRTLYGVMFPEAKAASYSLFSGLQAVGFLIASVTSPLLCTDIKLILNIALLTLSVAGYSAAEVKHRKLHSKDEESMALL